MTTPERARQSSGQDQEIPFSIDRFSNFVSIGSGWSSLTGWSEFSVIGKAFADFIHAVDRPAVLEAVQSLTRREIYSCRIPARCVRQDGVHCWVEIYAHPVLDDDGNVEGIRGTMVDITNRRKGMRALRESEARFRAICEASPLGVYVTDTYDRCIFANANFEQISGLRADQLQEGGYLANVHPQDIARVENTRTSARKASAPYREEHRYLHANGTQRWSRDNAAPILDGSNFLGFVHVVEDITAQRTAAEALRQSEERLQLALEGSGHALLDWDVVADDVYLSEQWNRMIGGPLGPARTCLRDLLDLLHPDEREDVERALHETLEEVRPFLHVNGRVRTSSGSFKWIEIHARVTQRDAAGKALRLTGTCADITDRKNIEARQAEFIATVSHEMRTPLSSVLGALDVLNEEYRDRLPAEAARFLDMAVRNGEQLSTLINSVLDLERIETGVHDFEYESMDILDLLTRAAEANEPYAMKLNVRLEVEAPRRSERVWTDPTRALQILTNLISNAVKFSASGDRVVLSTELRKDKIRMAVRDFGPGIPQASQARIFQRFGQASNQEHARMPGSGLGLSICKALAERLGGDIGFSTEVGQGSMFWVDLPRVKTAAEHRHHRDDDRLAVNAISVQMRQQRRSG
ncbi:MAG TPA: PAS domain S-box protein [Burkholderiales bacterium]|nr:PAS domain S-box protein [Burkholderiales bacterium]